MKTRNIVSFLILILINSCSPKEHLKFNNVPLDGPLDQFAIALTKAGFIIADSTMEREIVLKGDFLSKDCEIHVFGTENKNLAYKVMVSLPGEDHDSLKSDFGKLQKLFSLKYGLGTSQYQQFKKRERLEYKVPAREVMTGDFTKYATDSGDITIEVQKRSISITYLDRQNNEIWKRELGEGKKDQRREE
jgi:hypothetical protein